MRLKLIWAGVVMLWVLATAAAAPPGTPLLQTHLPPTKFERNLSDVVTQAKEQYRLIVFYLRNDADPAATKAMDERVWRNPTLAAHIRWHSLAYQAECRQGGLASMLSVTPRECPAVVVARVNGDRLEVLSRMVTVRNPLMEGVRARKDRTMGLQIDEGNIPDIYPGTVKVLQDTDTALQALKARDPVWGEHHDLKNPPPQPPPEPDPLYEMEDDGAPAVSDPEPTGGMVDVYARLDEARDAVLNGNLGLAIGLYTWLWERGDKADPSFRAVKRSVVADEMRRLAQTRLPSQKRFRRLKSLYDERLLWTSYERLADWFLLNAVVGDEMETVAYLDLFINDLDEGSMLPDCDRIAYRLLAGRGLWNDAYDLGERPAVPPAQLGSDSRFKPVVTHVTRRAARLVQADAGGRTTAMDAADRAKVEDFRRVFVVDECARLHAACLRAGRERDAWRVADTLIGARPEPGARLALVAAAVATGEVRPRHLQLLDEAHAGGLPHPVLRDRVADALAETPGPSGDAAAPK